MNRQTYRHVHHTKKSYVITSTKEQAVKSYFQQNVGQRAQQTEGTSFLLWLESSK